MTSLELTGWTIFGFIGQLIFMARFLVQWIYSELKKQSLVPISFWFLSLGGSAILLAYAIHKKDPVFILGQCVGFIVYTRNLVLVRRRRPNPQDG